MEHRQIQRLGREVSVVGLGTWQLGADWGSVDPSDAHATLEAAVAAGITFFDTADAYGDGRSEQFCGELHRNHPEVFVATKMGRRVEQVTENYNRAAFLAWNDRSRQNLGMGTLDLVQLHCPPDGVYANDAAFDALDEMVSDGRIAAYGVSVETCAQALAAISRPGVATVQIILNCLRLKPLDEVLPAAREAGVGIIARVPLASGLLSGRYDENTTFAPDDHRSYNRHGEAFDVGETFSGVPFEIGLDAVRELRGLVGDEVSAGAVRAALGDRPARREHRDPGRAQSRAGPRQRGRRLPAATLAGPDRRRPRRLRPAHSRARPRSLVIAPAITESAGSWSRRATVRLSRRGSGSQVSSKKGQQRRSVSISRLIWSSLVAGPTSTTTLLGPCSISLPPSPARR